MVDRVEAGICAVNRMKEWQKVHSTKYAGKWPFQEMLEVSESAVRKSIDVGNELDLILQLEYSIEIGPEDQSRRSPAFFIVSSARLDSGFDEGSLSAFETTNLLHASE